MNAPLRGARIVRRRITPYKFSGLPMEQGGSEPILERYHAPQALADLVAGLQRLERVMDGKDEVSIIALQQLHCAMASRIHWLLERVSSKEQGRAGEELGAVRRLDESLIRCRRPPQLWDEVADQFGRGITTITERLNAGTEMTWSEKSMLSLEMGFGLKWLVAQVQMVMEREAMAATSAILATIRRRMAEWDAEERSAKKVRAK